MPAAQRAAQPARDSTLCRAIVEAIDLTSLNDDDTVDDITDLCRRASTRYGPVASVCVWPKFVHHAARSFDESRVRVAAVANFPNGDNDIDRALADARYIVESGGDEIDVVFPWRFLAAGDNTAGVELISEVRNAIGPDITLKAILETGELHSPALITAAADQAIAGGADFLKTSTGKTSTGATLPAVGVLLQVLADHEARRRSTNDKLRPVGLKISGGIRTVDDVIPYLELIDDVMGESWRGPSTFRIGASSLLTDVLKTCVLAESNVTP